MRPNFTMTKLELAINTIAKHKTYEEYAQWKKVNREEHSMPAKPTYNPRQMPIEEGTIIRVKDYETCPYPGYLGVVLRIQGAYVYVHRFIHPTHGLLAFRVPAKQIVRYFLTDIEFYRFPSSKASIKSRGAR